ncbi:hypothetical protein OV207_09990, partial [Corallococcus sp. BB11-1]|uniref:hypothetical protein n=1 Tax=Corallococcus sp. BB11-1 TaxID=2996783 RepID=UPI00227038DA
MAASEERRFQSLVLAPIRRVRRRLNAVAWLGAGLVPVWATATACVLCRMLLRNAAVWAVPPLVVAGLAWWFVRARSRGVSLEYAAVLADRSAGAGGLLLTRLERTVGDWELSLNQLAQQVKLPEVPWRRPVGTLLGALLFLAVGFLVPLPALRASNINAAAATQVAAVQAQAEALAREEPLGQDVEEELRRLSDEVAQGRFDSADWEASDALEQRLAERASEAAAELNRASEAAAELEDALAAAGGAESATRERESLEQALMALDARSNGGQEQDGASEDGEPRAASGQGSQGQGAGEQGGDTQDSQAREQGGDPQGAQQGSGDPSREAQARASARAQASGSPDQVADLRRTLERRQQALAQRFGEENNAAGNRGAQARRPTRRQQSGQGQGPQGQGQRGQGQGQQGGDGDGEGEGQGQGGQHASRGVRPGRGAGVGRGGESSPLVFGGEAEMDPDRLAFQPLPEG